VAALRNVRGAPVSSTRKADAAVRISLIGGEELLAGGTHTPQRALVGSLAVGVLIGSGDAKAALLRAKAGAGTRSSFQRVRDRQGANPAGVSVRLDRASIPATISSVSPSGSHSTTDPRQSARRRNRDAAGMRDHTSLTPNWRGPDIWS